MNNARTRVRLSGAMMLGVLTLAACQAQPPIVRTDVTRSKSFVATGPVGSESTSVVTYRMTAAARREVKGMPCKIVGRGNSASFVTPAVVMIPDYGPATPLPRVTCRIDDEAASVQVKKQNGTEEDTTGALLDAGGLAGLVLGGAISGMRNDKSDDDYRFWPINVEFPEK